jgi:formylglycine-generating enzyme
MWTWCDKHYPEEAPVHRVRVHEFWMDPTPVTNRQFKEFVKATGHVTFAEIPPTRRIIRARCRTCSMPDRSSSHRRRTGLIYATGVNGGPFSRAPNSNIKGLDNHPVVHVTFSDALAYAKWAGKDLPSEAEWEFAARGGLDSAEFAWGDELTPGSKHMANTWQGEFPRQNTCEDGFARTSPVCAFPANGYGLYDMIGNVWEWTRRALETSTHDKPNREYVRHRSASNGPIEGLPLEQDRHRDDLQARTSR